jgi:hypothetical protein
MVGSFSVTWDYLCPFARNAHEHLAAALQAGAGWDVHFSFFSLSQVHLAEGEPAVWDDPERYPGVLAGLAGIVVRDRVPERFLDAHMALFAARHDDGLDLRDRHVVSQALKAADVDGAAVLDEVDAGWPVERARAEQDEALQRWAVFGVPTFIVDEKAVFVRFMHRPDGDAELARTTIGRVLDLVEGFPELNELKYTKIPR